MVIINFFCFSKIWTFSGTFGIRACLESLCQKYLKKPKINFFTYLFNPNVIGYIFYTIGHEKCRPPLLFSWSTSTGLLFSTWLTVDAHQSCRHPFYSLFHHAQKAAFIKTITERKLDINVTHNKIKGKTKTKIEFITYKTIQH